MKRISIFLFAILMAYSLFAQSPEKMSYQAVVRDINGNLITDATINMQISILQGSASGTAVYVETQSVLTNKNGLLSIEIGMGDVLSGTFSAINWAEGPYFLKTETDPEGGTNYTITGISQLLSVPYALHAKEAESVANETDPVFSASPAADVTQDDIMNLDNLSGVNTGDQDLSGFLTSEIDPIWTASPSFGITNELILDWDSAYSWGNHQGLYRPISWVPAWDDITEKPIFANVATSGSYNDLIDTPTIINSQWTTVNSDIYYGLGSVGIGNQAPANSLHITTSGQGDDSETYALRLENDDFGLTTTGMLFSVEGGDLLYAKAGIAFERTGTYARGTLHFLNSSIANTQDVQLSESVMAIDYTGKVGIGTDEPASKMTVTGGDVYVTDVTKGIILKSPNGNCWRLTVSNTGAPVFTAIPCP